MFRSLMIILALTFTGCIAVDEGYIYGSPHYGCVNVEDEYGEHQVCGTQYYYTNHGTVYWDEHFGIWVYPGGYWRNNQYYRGYYPGYHSYYHHYGYRQY